MIVGERGSTRLADFRHRITIQSLTESLDVARQPVHSYSTRYSSQPAKYEYVSGNETNRGRQVEAGVTAIFTLSYRSGISTTDRVVFGSRTFGIVSIENPDGVQRFTVLNCREAPAS